MLLILNLIGGWKTFAESNWDKDLIDFSIDRLIGYSFLSQHLVQLQIYLYCKPLKKEMYYQQKFCVMKLCHLN